MPGARLASAESLAARRALSARLEARRAEIEEATVTRVDAVAAPPRTVGTEYAQGLRAAVSAAIDLGLETIARGDAAGPDIPPALLVQARLAARHDVGLTTVLRRYSAGYTLLGKLVAEAGEQEGLVGGHLAELLGVQAALFDRVVVAVSEEYEREHEEPASVDQRRLELVKGLLAGDLVDASALAYGFEGNHVGMVVQGERPREVVAAFADALACRPLTVAPGEGTLWAWLGCRSPMSRDRLDLPVAIDGDSRVALGEPGSGIAGWRRSHRQASAAALVAARRPGSAVRYRDVALVTSIIQDDVLAASLRELYLDPLRAGRAGCALVATLDAYFAAGRNSASAAATLGVTRQTVNNRLRMAEERLGRSLADCAADVEAALELDRFERTAPDGFAAVKPRRSEGDT